ncbi:hypothetical protein ACFH04_01990 [Streptomyces noboritoensis]|uniref:Uncharacterized protein n=1 Tax=Streptomyces noboritoensis TaxID=67337 RepID=A0ABV6TBK3_9ACTN
MVPPTADLSAYRAVVVPETTPVDDVLAQRLLAYRTAGGAVPLVGPALLKNATEPALPGLLPVDGLAPAPAGEVFLACQGVPGVREDLPVISLRAGGPVHLETTVVRTDGGTVVHLVSFVPARETPELDLVHDPFPLIDVPVAVKLDGAPRSVRLQPAGQELPWQYDGAYVHVRVTTADGHAMVVVEHD